MMTAQHLDSMDLEKERGITIKSHPVTMHYRAKDGRIYKLNLMDTPGHVDFSYEVSRSLAACEGAVLLIDAAQGVEAQTVANAHLAFAQKLKVIPVINKIDLPSANLERCTAAAGGHPDHPGRGGDPGQRQGGHRHRGHPRGGGPRGFRRRAGPSAPQTRALVFDSLYDSYRGVIAYVRVFSGALRAGDMMMLMSTGQKSEVKEVGVFTPKMEKIDVLGAGRRRLHRLQHQGPVRDQDRRHHHPRAASRPPRCCRATRRCGRWSSAACTRSTPRTTRSSRRRSARLRLNDAAFVYQQESSVALGFGFRCGFLGLLHMEIIQERIRREHDVDIISTYPSVVYRVVRHGGEVIEVDNPVNLPDPRHDPGDPRADDQGLDPHPQRLHGRHARPRHGEARDRRPHRHPRRQPRDADAASCRSTRFSWISTTG